MRAIVNNLTTSQKAAMGIEIRKQIAENLDVMQTDLISIVLWQLHKQLGFVKKRLLRFYKDFAPALKKLTEYYDLPNRDQSFICKYHLKAIGVDVDDMTKAFCFEANIK